MTRRSQLVTPPRPASPVRNRGDGQWIKFQPWLTLVGAAASGDVIQPARDWIRSDQLSSYSVQIDSTEIIDCKLILETSLTVEGPWETSVELTMVSFAAVVLCADGGGTGPLYNFLHIENGSHREMVICIYQIHYLPAGHEKTAMKV
jgi:hypothetical protein